MENEKFYVERHAEEENVVLGVAGEKSLELRVECVEFVLRKNSGEV